MKRKNTLWSLVLALVMVLGVIAPVATLASQPGTGDTGVSKATETKTVTLHKLMMTKEELKAWDSKAIEEKGYNGEQNLTQLKALLKEGHSAKEADGVYFAWQVKGKETTTVEGKTVPQYIKKGTDVDGNPAPSVKTENNKKVLEFTTNIDEAFGGKTDKSAGITFNTEVLKGDLKGQYIIQEIKEKSTYQNKGNVIVDQKAVPVEITLPLVNNKGIVEAAHVYPKNTESKPVIDKNFAKDHGLKEVIKKGEAGNKTFNAGANYENYQEEKARAQAEVGKKIPYEVKTKIEAGTSYERLIWNDTMTKGLTYNKDLNISATNIKEQFVKGTDYNLVQDDNGFLLQLTDDGLKKISDITLAKKDAKDVEITLTYSATVNGTAVVDKPEKNNVKLEYGHKKGGNFKPHEVTPQDGKLKVAKTFESLNKEGKWATIDTKGNELDGLVLSYVLQKDGKDVTSVRLTKDTTGTIELGNGIEFVVSGPFSGEFQGLDKDATGWTISERVEGYNPEYAKEVTPGQVTITNKKDHDNPTPLEPTTPEVVVGAKKFVKIVEGTTDRLAGAKFVIKKTVEKKDVYLVAKSVGTLEADKNNLIAAKKKLDTAVTNYNKGEAGATKDAIDAAQKEYNKAFKAAGIGYEWKVASDFNSKEAFEDARITLSSNSDGQFEISGLEYGEYKLEEIEAPKGYAKMNDLKFEVAEGTTTDVQISYEKAGKTNDAKEVPNKTVTIPQTGGMGTALFMVAGLALMGGAFIAMRKRSAEQA